MQIAKRLPFYASLILLAYMPFHLFLAQSLSLITGGLEVWKVAKDVVVVLLTMFVICMVFIARRTDRTFWVLCGALVSYGLLHVVLWLFHHDIYAQSAILGTVYNVRLLCFLLIGYGTVRLFPGVFLRRMVLATVFAAATIVAALGVLQYFLPQDILTHIGYSIDRGARANFAIDDAAGFPRVMSTLRDPNSLGAYLLIPMGIACLALWHRGARYRQMACVGALALMTLALFMTFSRSAWIAAVVTVGLAALWHYRDMALMFVKRFGLLLVGLIIIGAGVAYSQRHSAFVTSYVTHSSQGSSDIDSNEYHWLFVKQGLEGIADQPFGHGPGTAGLASIQNPKGSFLTENYYVQLGYELGVMGLGLFVALQIWLYRQLWRHHPDPLAVVLLASFWGYVLMNMLLHTWSNEAVACQWWLLAGIVLALPPSATTKQTVAKKPS